MKWISIILFAVFTFPANPTFENVADSNWKLKKVVDGISVFTRDVAGSNLKELKITMVFKNTRLSSIMAVLDDAAGYKDWLYKCAEAKNVERVDQYETTDYYLFDFPWPLSDRDLYSNTKVSQDPSSKVVLIETHAVADRYSENEDAVRVVDHENSWQFTPLPNGDVELLYKAHSNPGGSIPDWMVNMVIDKGPTTSMKNLKKMIVSKKYASRQLSWIQD